VDEHQLDTMPIAMPECVENEIAELVGDQEGARRGCGGAGVRTGEGSSGGVELD
jgi:hypothetical protein